MPPLYSERKIPANIPRGTEKINESTINHKVPKIAFEMPPPISPTGLGSWLRNSQLTTEIPFLVIRKRIKNMGTIELSERTMMRVLNNLSTQILR